MVFMGNKLRLFNRSRIYFFAIISLIFFFTGKSYAADPTCQIAAEALTRAEALRGLKVKKKVPCTLETKETVLTFLKDSVTKKIPKRKLDGEERIYKALEFLPADFNYVNELLKLYADQVGGYYDPETRRYVMAAWLPPSLQPTIAVHELTHALQDQYFNLKSFMDDESFTSDELLARSALVEGDATVVMNEYQLGAGVVAKMPSVDGLILQTVLGSYLTQGLSKAPEGIKNLMIFPYTSGLRFVHFFLHKGGYQSVNQLFKNPPKSTAEILHPELYPRKNHSIPDSVRAAALNGAKDVYEDTLGEFFTSTWLSAKIKDKTKSIQAAKGLINDRALVTESGEVIWITLWSEVKDAQEFWDVVKEASLSRCTAMPRGDRFVVLFC